ncbi:hypothetical protein BH11GEM2_BH11GEM2_06620 [soil metagenome]
MTTATKTKRRALQTRLVKTPRNRSRYLSIADAQQTRIRFTILAVPSKAFHELPLRRGVYLSIRGGTHGGYTLFNADGQEVAHARGVPVEDYDTAAPRRDLWPELRKTFAEILAASDPSDSAPLHYRGWLPYEGVPAQVRVSPAGYNETPPTYASVCVEKGNAVERRVLLLHVGPIQATIEQSVTDPSSLDILIEGFGFRSNGLSNGGAVLQMENPDALRSLGEALVGLSVLAEENGMLKAFREAARWQSPQ